MSLCEAQIDAVGSAAVTSSRLVCDSTPCGVALIAPVLIAKADDAPAPSIVISGLDLRVRPNRDAIAEWMAPSRLRAMDMDSSLGAKTIVLVEGSGGLEAEFFQGMSDGSFDVTSETCVNSLACAAAAALEWGVSTGVVVDLRMAGSLYRFEVAT